MKKKNFEDISGALNRDEMKKIMAGSGGGSGAACSTKQCISNDGHVSTCSQAPWSTSVCQCPTKNTNNVCS